MATHSSILAWKFPRTEEPSGLLSMGLQRFRHDLATEQSTKGKKKKKKKERVSISEPSEKRVIYILRTEKGRYPKMIQKMPDFARWTMY